MGAATWADRYMHRYSCYACVPRQLRAVSSATRRLFLLAASPSACTVAKAMVISKAIERRNTAWLLADALLKIGRRRASRRIRN
ncbi:hypothetical protein BER93_14325 [Xanthomonas fragariae]|nr:hypothetical protein BER92_14290 [Xanthomonas fragariae]AOD19080.1 hypothetical protein BER93_14325 [Xanthomonas fragariae]ENZ93687.1 hypothetical protein O1K_20086 [Xanthomonas fragariae LMG 25863]